jgi:hypothetical protein
MNAGHCTCGANTVCAGINGPPPHKPDCAAIAQATFGTFTLQAGVPAASATCTPLERELLDKLKLCQDPGDLVEEVLLARVSTELRAKYVKAMRDWLAAERDLQTSRSELRELFGGPMGKGPWRKWERSLWLEAADGKLTGLESEAAEGL